MIETGNKRKTMNTKHWKDLTSKEQSSYGDGCGPGRGLLGRLIPELYFHADCQQHDFYYSRGGDLFQKFEADVMFFAHMIKSVNEVKDRWYKKVLPFTAAVVYFVAVSIGGLLLWDFKRSTS